MQPCKANSAALIGCPRPVFFSLFPLPGLKAEKANGWALPRLVGTKSQAVPAGGVPPERKRPKNPPSTGKKGCEDLFLRHHSLVFFDSATPFYFTNLFLFSAYIHTYILAST
jgi:hypothetical protein